MLVRSVVFGAFFTAILNAEEIPRDVQIVEPPSSLVVDTPEKVISSTGKFSVIGGEAQDRSAMILLAEEAQSELLRLTDEKDARNEGDAIVPISITLQGQPGDPMPRRTHALEILSREAGYELRISVHLCRGIEKELFKRVATAALIYERTLRVQKAYVEGKAFMVPPWLVEGLLEATAWRLNQSDRRLYQALFKTGGIFKIDDLFALDDPAYENIDGAMRAAFRVSSGALVMALLQQPQGKTGFRNFLTEVAGFEGEMPALLRKHFPELNLSETSLAKWRALQMANIGGQNLLTDIMTVAQTEQALSEALRLNFRTEEGIIQEKEMSAWPELAALSEQERASAVRRAQESLVRLSYRCFSSYRPMLLEYQVVLNQLIKNETKDLAAQLAAIDERRATMVAKAERARDFLDWYEISTARETSGVFDDYLRLKDRLKSNPHRRDDALSKYLDKMETLFTREGDEKMVAPQQASDFSELPLLDLPPLK
jgi:hypothetical protein